MWMARYMLSRIAEDFNLSISYDPKLYDNFAGAGGHINFSTESMRKGEGGLDNIIKIVKNLGIKHKELLEVYGDNSKRLTGEFETSKKEVFTYGVGNRNASIRIPTFTIN
jgi:glutamine synthetase